MCCILADNWLLLEQNQKHMGAAVAKKLCCGSTCTAFFFWFFFWGSCCYYGTRNSSLLQSKTTGPRWAMGFSTDWLVMPLRRWFGLLMQTTQSVYDCKESSNALLLAKARASMRQN
jgi:hypothetical protein